MSKHFLQQSNNLNTVDSFCKRNTKRVLRSWSSTTISLQKVPLMENKRHEIVIMAPFPKGHNPSQIFTRCKGSQRFLSIDRCYWGNSRDVCYRCRKLLLNCGTNWDPTSFMSIVIRLKIPSFFHRKSNLIAAYQPPAINPNMKLPGTEKPSLIIFTFNTISSSLLRFSSLN
jgi:hypothetical protein